MDFILESIWFFLHGKLAGRREFKMMRKMVDYSSHDSPYRSVGKQREEYSLGIAYTLRCLREEIRSCKADNDKLVEAQERLAMFHEN